MHFNSIISLLSFKSPLDELIELDDIVQVTDSVKRMFKQFSSSLLLLLKKAFRELSDRVYRQSYTVYSYMDTLHVSVWS
jgi:hypothetical protein